jgi:hypothetical protein
MTYNVIMLVCAAGAIGAIAPTIAFLLLLQHHDRAVKRIEQKEQEIQEMKRKLEQKR